MTKAADPAAAAEAALVARIARGDNGEPVALLYRRYGGPLFRFGVQYLGNHGLAEEMVQETFVRLWRSASRFDASKASVGTYLFVLARSAAADLYKRPSSRQFLPDTDIDESTLPDNVDQILNSMIIREAVDSLTESHAEVIRLTQEGLTQRQIAERLEVPLGTVKTRTFHGMRALRAALTKRGFHGA